MKLKNLFWVILSAVALSTALVSCEGEDDGRGDFTPDIPDFEGLEEITSEDFKVKVFDVLADPELKDFKGSRPVFLDFGAEWCSNCHKMHPVIEKIAGEFFGAVDAYYVTEENCPEVHQAFAAYYGLKNLSLPSYVTITEEGVVVAEPFSGLMSEDAVREIFADLAGDAPAPLPVVGIRDITNEDFDKLVFDLTTDPEMKTFLGERPVILDFGAEWCSNCHKMHPVMDAVAKQFSGKVDFYYLDDQACSNAHAAFSKLYGLQNLSLPSYVTITKDGKILEQPITGLMSSEAVTDLAESLLK